MKKTKLTLADRKCRHINISSPDHTTYTVVFDGRGKNPQVEETHYIRGHNVEGRLDKLILLLQEFEEKFEDARLEIDPYVEYGDHMCDFYIHGNRPVTPEELEEAEQVLLQEKDLKLEREKDEVEKAAAILREKRPELLR